MYENNVKLLEKKIKEHAYIRPIAKHRKPDGSFDFEGNLKLWDEVSEDFEKIWLWPDGEKTMKEGTDAAYMIFIPAEQRPDGKNADTVLVAHGGGFGIRTGCEGANVAWEFHRRGYNTAILVYRMLPHTRYESLSDMQRAIRILRGRAEELSISDKITVMGFSAGAMLAGNAAVYSSERRGCDGLLMAEGTYTDDYDKCSAKPDLAVISYGAMSCVSFPVPFMSNADLSLFGDSDDDKFYFATEKHISRDTCPMFIWQTLSDDGRHGMVLARALQDAGIPYELHIMDGGVHGLALADGENDLEADIPHINHWVQLCDEWMKMQMEKNREI